MAARDLKVLIAAAEVAPFAKVGGLADVAGALPKALKALGHDVRVVMPSYKMVEDNPQYAVKDLIPPFDVPIHEGFSERASVKLTRIAKDVPVYLVASDRYFVDATDSRKVYSLQPEPYIFFDRAVAEMVPRLSPAWQPDVIHCNDWHTGLIPVFLDLFYSRQPEWSGASRVFTIHNLAYQGEFDFETLRRAGLPDWLFTYDKLEFYGKWSFMKGGLVFSDAVNTVSKTYAEEIQTPEYGCRLDGLLRYLACEGRLTGIVNGVDYEEYDPASDPRIPVHYSAADPKGKAECKAALQKESGLSVRAATPVIGIISRLADQKGFDLIAAVSGDLLRLPIQLVLLGTGDERYEKLFRQMEDRNPGKVKAYIGFDAILAQRIYAGSDMFLMPSRFEPCGLGQLMSLRYGTIPIVRATGGLADTIDDYGPGGRGNGFAFAEYSPPALLKTVQRAVEAFSDHQAWGSLVRRAMSADFSWSNSAKKYVQLYRQAQSFPRTAQAS